jgi:hypothetical protein
MHQTGEETSCVCWLVVFIYVSNKRVVCYTCYNFACSLERKIQHSHYKLLGPVSDMRKFSVLLLLSQHNATRRKPAPAPLCPPQIPHDQTRDRARAAAVGSQRLTAWAMAWPFLLRNSTWPFLLMTAGASNRLGATPHFMSGRSRGRNSASWFSSVPPCISTVVLVYTWEKSCNDGVRTMKLR